MTDPNILMRHATTPTFQAAKRITDDLVITHHTKKIQVLDRHPGIGVSNYSFIDMHVHITIVFSFQVLHTGIGTR